MGSADPLWDSVHAAPGAAAAAIAWRYGGALHITVIAKATFAFAVDGPVARVAPQPILRADVHHLNNPARSVRFASDLGVYLQRVDVLFTGHAHAVSGPARAQTARVALYRDATAVLDKRVLVADPRGFTRMPLMYERAYGGIGFLDNPFGVGANGASGGEPNVLHASNPTLPSGFAPIGKAWPARKALRGETPRKALEAPIADVPDDFDWAYFQAAPPDQQLDDLRGDEWIVLEGLHPTLPVARMQLPQATAEALVFGLAGAGTADGSPLELHVDTVRIDGDEQLVTLVFRNSFTVPDDAALQTARFAAGVATPAEPIRYPDVTAVELLSDDDLISIDESPSTHRPAPALSMISTYTGESVGDDPHPVLPFRPSHHASSFVPAERRPPAPRRDSEDRTALFSLGDRRAAEKAALPWYPVEPAQAPSVVLPPAAEPPPLEVSSPAAAPLPGPPPASPSAVDPSPAPTNASNSGVGPPPAPSRLSPWAESPPEPAAPPPAKVPVQKPGVPGASPVIKEKLYGRFGVA